MEASAIDQIALYHNRQIEFLTGNASGISFHFGLANSLTGLCSEMRIMKIRQIVVACIALLGLMFIWSKTGQTEPPLVLDQIMSAPKGFSSIDKYVFVRGRWKRTGGNLKLNIPPRINTISITCDKNSMICKEIIAYVVTPQEEPLLEKPDLSIAETIYQIVDWSNDVIIAKYKAPVADVELRISLRDELAEKRWRETKARGSKGSDPNKYLQWILE